MNHPTSLFSIPSFLRTHASSAFIFVRTKTKNKRAKKELHAYTTARIAFVSRPLAQESPPSACGRIVTECLKAALARKIKRNARGQPDTRKSGASQEHSKRPLKRAAFFHPVRHSPHLAAHLAASLRHIYPTRALRRKFPGGNFTASPQRARGKRKKKREHETSEANEWE